MNDDIILLQDEINELEEKKKELENGDNKDEYDNYLDEVCGEIKIGTLSYSPSQVLKAVDEIAYNCGLNEYNDEKITELNDELEEKQDELKQLLEEEKEIKK